MLIGIIINTAADVSINNNFYAGYTSNIYKNKSELNDNYAGDNLTIFYNNEAFSIDSYFEYLRYFDYKYGNYIYFNIEPRYIVPLSLKSDLIFKAGINNYLYPNDKYMNNYDYILETTYKYDTLFSLRNLLTLKYRENTFPQNNLDFNEVSISDSLYYYVNLETVLNFYMNYTIVYWEERKLYLDPDTISNKTPKDSKIESKIDLEYIFNNIFISNFIVRFEKQNSDLNSVIQIDENTEKFEKDIYSYNVLELANIINILYENWTIEIENNYLFKKYDERKIFYPDGTIGDETVYNNIYSINVFVEKQVSTNAGINLNFYYENNNSNDYYLDGEGFDIEGGIYYQF
jgi:hypothetical protein